MKPENMPGQRIEMPHEPSNGSVLEAAAQFSKARTFSAPPQQTLTLDTAPKLATRIIQRSECKQR